jgi:hypothetical protein
MANKFFTPIKARFFSSPSSTAIDVGVNNDTNPRFSVDAGGRVTWGPGDAAGDVALYRDELNVLKTDDTFKTDGLYVGGIEIDFSGASDGEVLTYDFTSDKWAAAAGGGGSASVTVSSTPPTGPAEGDLWFNSVSGKTFIYFDDNWVDTSGPVVDFVAQRVAARGDILVATSATEVKRFAVGPNNYVLAADSSTPNGVSWLDVGELAPPVSGDSDQIVVATRMFL